MNDALFLVLRRLRRPILLIVASLAISVFGLANIPGVEIDGQTSYLGYFYAFYVMSYTATTVGFGEIPHVFSNAQRLWIIFWSYGSVVCWMYGLGVILQMIGDQAFRMALSRGSFRSRVRRLAEPFILIVGYGKTGSALAHMLDRVGYRSVILERSTEQEAQIALQEFQNQPLSLNLDGSDPEVLIDAGVTHPQCQALVAIAGDDDTTQAVAISATALNPSLRVIARTRSQFAESNLESFNKIELINPFETFAFNFGQSFAAPDKLQLEDWLTGIPGARRSNIVTPPKGHWVICGFGRFGHYIAEALTSAGLSWTAIDPSPNLPEESGLLKKPYSQETLVEAMIEHSIGIVACTDSDTVNFSAVRRARMLNPKLFVVLRQVSASNDALIEAANPNLRFNMADIMSHEVRQLITSPLLNRFIAAMRADTDDLTRRASAALAAAVGDRVPYLWVFSAWAAYPGLREAFAWNREAPFNLGDLLVHPNAPSQKLLATPLLLVRGAKEMPLPETHIALQSGDRILFAGVREARDLQRLHQLSPSPLPLIRTGVEPTRSWFFRKVFRKG
jgi:Trk K+ transport system NAD-binding subunit